MTRSGLCRSRLAMTLGRPVARGGVGDDVRDEHRLARRRPNPEGRQAAEAAAPPVEEGHPGGIGVEASGQLDQTGVVPAHGVRMPTARPPFTWMSSEAAP
jgi:hypothetical protein